jgi:hypothetical protein
MAITKKTDNKYGYKMKWGNWVSHTLLVGVRNGTTVFENSLTVLKKVKYRITR